MNEEASLNRCDEYEDDSEDGNDNENNGSAINFPRLQFNYGTRKICVEFDSIRRACVFIVQRVDVTPNCFICLDERPVFFPFALVGSQEEVLTIFHYFNLSAREITRAPRPPLAIGRLGLLHVFRYDYYPERLFIDDGPFSVFVTSTIGSTFTAYKRMLRYPC